MRWTKDIPQKPREGNFNWCAILQPFGDLLSQEITQALWWMRWQQNGLRWSQAANEVFFFFLFFKELLISSNPIKWWSLWDCIETIGHLMSFVVADSHKIVITASLILFNTKYIKYLFNEILPIINHPLPPH